jgi:DNA ligase-associated metallophosphoesterase
MKAIDTQIAGQRMRIDARRALFWSDENALLVADLHLGKASLLRQGGTPLPPGTTTEGLARLSSLIADYRPQRLLILGDLVHGTESRAAPWLEMFAAWRESHSALELRLISGNHDKTATLDQLRVAGFDEWEIGNILLRHKPDPHPSRYVIAGHLHPGATLRDGRLSQRFPAFWIGPKRCLLPAFGPLTGLTSSSPEQNDRVAILTPGGVVMKRSSLE